MAPIYRKDVDGLRTLAIVPILLYHAGVSSISGGFVGVDVFYVISGYLITSIIVPDIAKGGFSLLDFYRRRMVRIFPALYVVLFVTLFVMTQVLFPDDLRALAHSTAAAGLFVSNVDFWLSAGYFGPAAETLPLLHTWSLGVEMQFYVVYPLVLLAVRRFARGREVGVLTGIALLSFVVAQVWAFTAPTAGFYLLPARAWELLLGGLVAIGGFPSLATARWRNIASLAGVALFLVGLVLIRSTSLFPAPWALLPALGTALLIAYGAEAVTSRVLTTPIFRGIGLISYSLYLWHWPIITFWRFRNDPVLTPLDTVIVVALSFAFATASYFFVERPTIRGWRSGSSARLVAGGVATMAATVGVAWGVAASGENWRTYPPEVRKVASYSKYQTWDQHQSQFIEGTCFVSLGMVYDRDNCLRMSNTKPNMLLFGDSHAAQYWRAIADRYTGYNVMQATGAACRPMHGVSTESHCNDFVPYVLDRFLPTHSVDVIVLAGRWLDGEDQILVSEIEKMRARGAKVVVIGPVAEYAGETPALLADAMMRGDLERFAAKRVMERRVRDRAMAPLVRATGAIWVSAWDIECPSDRCRPFDPEGGPMHFDYGHVTLAGTRLIVAGMPDL